MIKMVDIKQLWHLEKAVCQRCGRQGYKVVEDTFKGFEEWLRLSGQTFQDFILEQKQKYHRNIVHLYGCAECRPSLP